mmetsp:Transcript_12491/g.29426  ORF Transcript_12491/g.29426 Transcript_12491/m.29426 type:complete len:126 (-) Transcript_12491:19-396(-)
MLDTLLHDDVIFHPPTYWKTRKGKMTTMWILQQVGGIFGSTFVYHRQLLDGTGTNAVLEFSAMVDEIPVQGVDIITFDGNGPSAKIVDFKVMLRPPEGALRLKQHMELRLKAMVKPEAPFGASKL